MICPEGEGEIQGSSISPESYDWPNELIEYCKHGCLEVCFSVFSFSACRSQPFWQLITPNVKMSEGLTRDCLDCLLWATVGTWQPLWKRKAPSGFYRLCGWLAVLWLVLASSKCKALVSQRSAREEFRTFEGAPLCSIHSYRHQTEPKVHLDVLKESRQKFVPCWVFFCREAKWKCKGHFHLSTCRKAILTQQIALLNFKCFLHLYHKKMQ